MATSADNVHFFGIRHHGPGCARSLLQALEALQPDCLLVEGPPEGEALLPMLQSAELRPPVAMLVYMQDEPSQAAFYPFAEFSPEWQALQWASRRGVATRFIDLPQTHGMAIEFARREALKKAAQEAEDFVNEVPEKLPFMATSCCPAWSVMAKKLFPDYANCISMALTPMTLTARLIKKHNPNAKVVFVGPCAAKKLEAMRRSVRSEVDFVLTFEEMSGIFDARQVDVSALEEDPDGVSDASVDGRNFAVSGGVAKSVENVIREKYPDREIKMANAEGLKECRKLLTMAKAGKYNGYLLEGMACPGGCVAGAGTMQSIKKSQAAVNKYAAQAKHKISSQTEYVKELDKLVD